MYKIFIVEDDFSLAKELKKQIESYGNIAICATAFDKVTEEFLNVNPQLVLMDIKLPYKDGYYWCREIRNISPVPIVFLSSASDNLNIVMAMNMGGDDFIAKPVDPMVLNSKLSAILRRSFEMNYESSIMEFNGAKFNLADGSLEYEDRRIDLTKNEMKILQILLENKGKIVGRDVLMTRLWQNDLYVEENTLTVNMARLRKKLEENGLKDIIITKPGSGYILQ